MQSNTSPYLSTSFKYLFISLKFLFNLLLIQFITVIGMTSPCKKMKIQKILFVRCKVMYEKRNKLQFACCYDFIMDVHEHIKQYKYFRFLKTFIFTYHLLLLFVEFYYENLCEKHEMELRQIGCSVLYGLQVIINLFTYFTLVGLKFLPHLCVTPWNRSC